LDLGCGNGDFLALVSQLGWQVQGLEPDPAAAKIARERGFPVLAANVETADFTPDSFDAITLSHVLEHLLNPAETLERITRWLKPRGTLVTITPNPVSGSATAFGKFWYALDAPRHLVIPSPRGLKRLFQAVSLEPQLFCIAHPGAASRSAEWMRENGVTRPWYAALVPWLEILPNIGGKMLGDNVVCLAMKPQ
jgi:2-polyprenyl-3-methyl-5-hydroxy-6-metoxy-1,4-benzoquinol methylase